MVVMKFLKLFSFLIIFLSVVTIATPNSYGQTRTFTLLLDAELDDYLNNLAAPLLTAAGINPDNVQVHLLQDPSINAFVNSQTNIFVMSGLLTKAKNENEVVGVLAHEIGHMKGHHLLRIRESSENMLLPALMAGVIGIGAVAAGAPDAGMAMVVGSQAANISAMLKFSRTQEQQADQIAVGLLAETKQPVQGLKSFFGRLRTNELMYNKAPPQYLLTHPRSSDRQGFLEQAQSIPYNPTVKEQTKFERIQAKLFAITRSNTETQRRYLNHNDANSDYARAITYTIQGKKKEAIKLLNSAAKKYNVPSDPYINELRGQIELDSGNIQQAQNYFALALKSSPHSPLIHFNYGRTLVETENYDKAIAHFAQTLHKQPQWWMAHYHMGLAYGRDGRKTKSHISFAQASMYRRNIGDALFHLKVAEKLIADSGQKNTLDTQKIAILKQELEKMQN